MMCNITDSVIDDGIRHKLSLDFNNESSWKDLRLTARYSKGKEGSLESETLELPLLISEQEESSLLFLLTTRNNDRKNSSN